MSLSLESRKGTALQSAEKLICIHRRMK